MKKFNTVACIIVLVLAIASAVCSYFLYEKRVLFINGWEQMTTAISTSASTIDTEGQTKFAHELTADKLSHEKYTKDGMARQLKALTDQSTAFVNQYKALVELQANTQKSLDDVSAQRDYMADVLAKIGKQAGIRSDKEKLANLLGYRQQVNAVNDAVNTMVKAQNVIFEKFSAIVASANGGKLNYKDLFGKNVNSGIAPILNAFKFLTDLRKNYADGMKALAARVNVQFNDDGSKTSADKVIQAVNAELAKVPGLQKQYSEAQREIGDLKTEITNRDAKIAELQQVIVECRLALGLKDGDADPKVWRRGSEDARAALTGEVIKVDSDYGYIVVDFGTTSTVTQVIGNRELIINPDLETGLEFNVSRDGEWIATVTLNGVDTEESTANIPADKIGQIEVGDAVTLKK